MMAFLLEALRQWRAEATSREVGSADAFHIEEYYFQIGSKAFAPMKVRCSPDAYPVSRQVHWGQQ
jgi:hypothetical protein